MRKFFAIAGLVALAGLLVVAAAIWMSLREQQQLMAALKAKGYPTTLAELDPPVEHLPAEENAALFFEAAGAAQVRSKEDPFDLPKDPTEALSSVQMEYLAKCTGDNKESLDLLRKAAAMKKGRYSLSLAADPAQALPFLSRLRPLGDLLQWEAIYRAEQGDTEGAIQAIHAALRLSESFAPYPTVMMQLVRNACCRYATTALDRTLSRTALSDEQLARLSTYLEEAERVAEPAMARAMAGEMVYGANGLPGILGSQYRNSLCRMALAADAPPEERLAKFKAVTPRGITALNPAVITAPALTRAVESDLGTLACQRAARTCLALERYRLAQGNLPESLDSLVPAYLKAVPLDPFDGQPLRYERGEKGCVVYSVGPNGKDEHGAPIHIRQESGDESFRLYR